MKAQNNLQGYPKTAFTAKDILLATIALVFLLFAFMSATANAATLPAADDELTQGITNQLNNGPALNLPASVKRFYSARGYKANWFGAGADQDRAWAAMLMLDCVLQFGLNHADYHPADLLYTDLHDIFDKRNNVTVQKKARLELLLTDAILSFINNIHFGKYNPAYPSATIDKGGLSFDALTVLNTAMNGKDFMADVITAQPQGKMYQRLQARLHLVAGVQVGDCYEFPEAEVRKMALNMERLRWAAMDTNAYIQVNIPSYKLTFYNKGRADTFKVIVGKPGNNTPTLNSAITYFTTAPEWKVPHKIFVKELLPKAIKDDSYLINNHYSIYNDGGMLISPNKAYLLKILQAPARYRATQSAGCDNALGSIVFRFPNPYAIYLHDTPEQGLFRIAKRALSHGCIRVQYPVGLAGLLLKNDGKAATVTAMKTAVDKGITRNYYLKNALPIAITYITCDVVDGALVNYEDVYGLDNSLDMLMYRKNDPTLNSAKN